MFRAHGGLSEREKGKCWATKRGGATYEQSRMVDKRFYVLYFQDVLQHVYENLWA